MHVSVLTRVAAMYRSYVGHGDVFIGKCLRSAQTKLVLGCVLKISCRKLSFIRKLLGLRNSVIERFAMLNL